MNILVWLGNEKMHQAIYPNMKSLAKAFADMGHNVITCNTAVSEEVVAALSLLREERIIDLSVGCNGLGMKVKVNDEDQLDVYSDLDIWHISILLDEPFNPACNGFNYPARRHLITYLERSDLEYFSNMGIAAGKNKIFMPLGGTESGLDWEELRQRKRESYYNIVVSAGKFDCIQKWPRWEDYGVTTGAGKILDDIIDLLQNTAVSVVDAAQQVLHAKGMEEVIYFNTVAEFFPLILCYVKGWRRQRLLQELQSLGEKIDLFGSGWTQMDFSKNVQVHGPVSYQDMIQILTQAKVVVNDEAGFNNGAHDRVFTAMLNGAVVVSEYSTYLDENFSEGQDIFMFDWHNIRDKLDILARLLREDSWREDIAAYAYAKVINRHSWQQRAERLLEAVSMLELQNKLLIDKV